MRTALVVLAAGSGSRFGEAVNKVWLPLSGRRIISRSLLNAAKNFKNCRLVLVIDPKDEALAQEVIAREVPKLDIEIVYGGQTRHASEFNALQHLSPAIKNGEIDVVLIHDGARPLATPALFETIATTANEHGGAIPTVKVSSFELDQHQSENVVRVQTPQGYQAQPLLEAYELAERDGFTGTDTGACMEKYFPNIKTIAIPADPSNVKITYPQDLVIAEHVLQKRGYRD
ncbi:MAG: 2-C-methyl-D-erythritol 4-phosphate cytidylyltransferase [Actinomycetota bacterium]